MTTFTLLLVAIALAAEPPESGFKNCPPPIQEVLRILPPIEHVLPNRRGSAWVGALLLDVTGDGMPEVFIAATDQGGNAGEPWQVYRLATNGVYESVGMVFFHPFGFMIEGRELRTYWRLNAGSGRFISYRVSDHSIDEIESTAILAWNEPEYKRRLQEIRDWRLTLQGKRFAAKRRSVEDPESLSMACRQLD